MMAVCLFSSAWTGEWLCLMEAIGGRRNVGSNQRKLHSVDTCLQVTAACKEVTWFEPSKTVPT